MRESEGKRRYECQYSYHGKSQLPKGRRALTVCVLGQKASKSTLKYQLNAYERKEIQAFKTFMFLFLHKLLQVN